MPRPGDGTLVRALALAMVSASLFGVASADSLAAADRRRAELEAIRARGLDLGEVVRADELTPQMRSWVLERVPREGTPLDRLRILLTELLGPEGLGLEYDPERTRTAAETFNERRANCLSFALLFSSLAREVGVDTHYLKVKRLESYRRREDLIVASGHLTVGYGTGPEQLILEFRVGPGLDYRASTRVDDIAVLALYYSNRGAELVGTNEFSAAVDALETAVRLDPTLPEAWANLGVAQRRMGDLEGAERAYRRAIEVDDDHMAAYFNLAALLRLRGDRDAGRQLLRLLDQRGNRNPFIYLALGDQSLEGGRRKEAERFYRRALDLKPRSAEVHAAMGEWFLAGGDAGKAARWLERARALEPDDQRTARLEEGLIALEGGDQPAAGQEPPGRESRSAEKAPQAVRLPATPEPMAASLREVSK